MTLASLLLSGRFRRRATGSGSTAMPAWGADGRGDLPPIRFSNEDTEQIVA